MKLTWKHINLNARTLTIPAEDTKADREHRLPLSDFLHDLLKTRQKTLFLSELPAGA